MVPNRPHLKLFDANVFFGDACAQLPRETWLRLKQVHGDGVVVVKDGDTVEGVEADALVTSDTDVTLAIATADCAPIALSSPEGIVAAVHAGWRGMKADVIGSAVINMRELGATSIKAALGPCIHVECYEFGDEQLTEMVNLFGSGVRYENHLNMVEAVKATCAENDVELAYVHADCTACDSKYFSYRARKDEGRQLMLVWKSKQS